MHDEAVARARAAGVKCVQNDCIFREHAAPAGPAHAALMLKSLSRATSSGQTESNRQEIADLRSCAFLLPSSRC